MCVCVCRAQESYLWKLDRTENFSRMRLRLTHNYGGSLHRDASQLRDMGCVSEETLDTTAPDAALLSLVKVSYRSDTCYIIHTAHQVVFGVEQEVG